MFEVFVLTLQIRKLRRELDASQEKVSALTTQLSANVSEQEHHHTHRKTYITHLYVMGPDFKSDCFYNQQVCLLYIW